MTACDVVGLLHGHRHAEQRTALTARQGCIGCLCSSARPIEVAHDHGVYAPIVCLDAGNAVLQQLDGRDLARCEKRDHLPCGAVVKRVGCGQDTISFPGNHRPWHCAGGRNRRGGARPGEKGSSVPPG
jgi:hypothetical protein